MSPGCHPGPQEEPWHWDKTGAFSVSQLKAKSCSALLCPPLCSDSAVLYIDISVASLCFVVPTPKHSHTPPCACTGGIVQQQGFPLLQILRIGRRRPLVPGQPQPPSSAAGPGSSPGPGPGAQGGGSGSPQPPGACVQAGRGQPAEQPDPPAAAPRPAAPRGRAQRAPATPRQGLRVKLQPCSLLDWRGGCERGGRLWRGLTPVSGMMERGRVFSWYRT